MIDRIEIEGLFSAFDYSINMPCYGETIILTGPNGYGKTTILSIVDALCSLDLLYFYSVPFKSIKVIYGGRYELLIVSKSQSDEQTDDDLIELHSGIEFILNDKESIDIQSENTSIKLSTDWDTITRIQESMFPVRRHSYNNEEDGTLSSCNEFCAKDNSRQFNRRMRILNEIAQTKQLYASFMIIMRSLSVKAKFIPAQRLMSNGAERIYEIQRVAKELSKYLQHYHYEYLTNAQSHDEKFITRLMGDEGSISSQDYAEKVKVISSVIIEAKNFDLAGSFYIPDYSESKSGILKSYVEDLEEKLSSLKTPIKDLNLFHKLLLRKKFVGKRCIFSRMHGIQFVSENDMSVIPLTSLSSGEINQIIMLYEFIFNIADDSILMIDEPEISLHVVWQHEFMNDISEICREKNLSVLIATHSPQIIGSRWEECLDLYAVANA